VRFAAATCIHQEALFSITGCAIQVNPVGRNASASGSNIICVCDGPTAIHRWAKIGDKMVKGIDAVRKADAAMFTDSNRKLVWEPTDAHLFADGKNGVTTGRFKVVLKDSAGSEKSSPPART
jgi:hypothetical protein